THLRPRLCELCQQTFQPTPNLTLDRSVTATPRWQRIAVTTQASAALPRAVVAVSLLRLWRELRPPASPLLWFFPLPPFLFPTPARHSPVPAPLAPSRPASLLRLFPALAAQ